MQTEQTKSPLKLDVIPWDIGCVLLLGILIVGYWNWRANSQPVPSPTQADCRKAFSQSVIGWHGGGVDELKEPCAPFVRKWLSEIRTGYTINGSSLVVGNSVMSLYGLSIEKTDHYYSISDQPIHAVLVTSGGKSVELVFGQKQQADDAFNKIAGAIAQVAPRPAK